MEQKTFAKFVCTKPTRGSFVRKGESAEGRAEGGGTARVQRKIPMLLFVAVCLGNFLIH